MTTSTDEPTWLTIARGELGVRERPGSAHHPRIIEYHKTTRLHATTDEIPWCAAYVNWVLKQAGLVGTQSAAAASFRTWGQRCELRDGAIVVFGKSDPDAVGTGHVGFCVGIEGDNVLLLGGNQNNCVSIAKRPKSRIVAVRWPDSVEL